MKDKKERRYKKQIVQVELTLGKTTIYISNKFDRKTQYFE